jgi:hypothetical protein
MDNLGEQERSDDREPKPARMTRSEPRSSAGAGVLNTTRPNFRYLGMKIKT